MTIVRSRGRRLLALSCTLAAVLAACGSSAASPRASTAAATTTMAGSAPSSTATGRTTPGGTGTVGAVAGSTVRIVAQGTFVDPQDGASEGAGSGSGFVIDPSGIVVTNDHVVGGAGLLQVFVPGETAPRNAKVLGVSECSDLAVIDVEGADLPALSWHEGAVDPGLEVYAAGYPLGDPQYTLTRGIVAKVKANGETPWASVDHVLEHDATIQPGNSGGPLVDAQGRIVGIDYATGSAPSTAQYFAIDATSARPILDQLRAGKDVDAVGINGKIVHNQDGSIFGLFVAGISSGSPADEAGVLPGDLVTQIEGVSVGRDGTMADYCDVIRSHQPGAALSIRVLRRDTKEVLAGELNGSPLDVVGTIEAGSQDTTAGTAATPPPTDAAPPTEPAPSDPGRSDPGQTDPGQGTAADFVTITDDTGLLSIEVPSSWVDVDGSSTTIGGVSSPQITASPSNTALHSGWATPGAQVIASSALAGRDPNDIIDQTALKACTPVGDRRVFDNGALHGVVQAWDNCGGTPTSALTVAAFPADGAYGVYAQVVLVTNGDTVVAPIVLKSITASS